MPVLAGLIVALSIVLLGKATRQDDTVLFYTTVLIVMALVYVLFAVMAGTTSTIVTESAIGAIFVVLAIATAQWSRPRAAGVLIAPGLVVRGVYDFVREAVITNAAVPNWWPTFCGVVDVALGGWLVARRDKNPLKARLPTV